MINYFVNPFEKLDVWKLAHQFTLNIYKITSSFPKDEKFSLVDQIRRSSSSIAANIVEGNEKKSNKEFLQFLYTAKGSLAETKYFLILSRDLQYLTIQDYEKLLINADNIGKMINGLMKYLRLKINKD
ncbi:MAG: four helix bundle protein [bacterium]|nr:four helix bundle protein [bacterium]